MNLGYFRALHGVPNFNAETGEEGASRALQPAATKWRWLGHGALGMARTRHVNKSLSTDNSREKDDETTIKY
jgi:hypothetical protein